jgi:hypothetical protein
MSRVDVRHSISVLTSRAAAEKRSGYQARYTGFQSYGIIPQRCHGRPVPATPIIMRWAFHIVLRRRTLKIGVAAT